mmetsp:Transcript_40574/g.35999  ORF Transcript_40574/g.35999 Transcript_40574/m.35999 type:complete len:96 (-) Transcript_40574:227-514(-)|eukprot:CAMPEP_0114582164 /NCGR_PEP_ID=MMETSP0125-20121206/6189_1 /TAXON_ID=485358 ORGANISM="Aristerostoma sp., Strain ATCC 50986" /NCGR_SAMPLE_ID=MMETSP0125 /ASSEMBLY_ACC=CAM_ASM_000245 /LENGTH=95 /DNA_ID=CAMNT_0001774931 /DNA_START=553 /DNA_END=840 /DNA_ORIENTATION=+
MGISYSKEKYKKLLLTKTLSKLKKLNSLNLDLQLVTPDHEDLFQVDLATLLSTFKGLRRLRVPLELFHTGNLNVLAIFLSSMTSIAALKSLNINT